MLTSDDLKDVNEAAKLGAEVAIKQHLDSFTVDPKTHFKHHEFIKELMDGSKRARRLVVTTFIIGALGTLGTLLYWGLAAWGQSGFNLNK